MSKTDFEKFMSTSTKKYNAWKNSQTGKSNNTNNDKVTLALKDGKEFGTISSKAYRAITNNLLDYYKPVDDEEKKVLEAYKNHQENLMSDLIMTDGSSLGQITQGGLKAIENNSLNSYVPKNEVEKNTIEKYRQLSNYLEPEEKKTGNSLGTNIQHTGDQFSWNFKGALKGIANTFRDVFAEKMNATKNDITLNAAESWGAAPKGYNKKYGEIVDEQRNTIYADIKKSADEHAKQSALIDLKYPDLSEGARTTGKLIGGSGQVIPMIAASALNPTLGTVVFGSQVYGNSIDEALGDGATLDQARTYGGVEAIKEIAIERIFGGLPFTKGIADKAVKPLTNKFFSNAFVREIFRQGANKLGEGFEEVAAELITPYIKRAIYDKDAPNVKFEELAFAFAGGVVNSFLLGVSSDISTGVAYKNLGVKIDKYNSAIELLPEAERPARLNKKTTTIDDYNKAAGVLLARSKMSQNNAEKDAAEATVKFLKQEITKIKHSKTSSAEKNELIKGYSTQITAFEDYINDLTVQYKELTELVDNKVSDDIVEKYRLEPLSIKDLKPTHIDIAIGANSPKGYVNIRLAEDNTYIVTNIAGEENFKSPIQIAQRYVSAGSDAVVQKLINSAIEKESKSSEVKVGDTFKDTKTGNTITVVERDAENTTVEISTGEKTETREFTNSQADTLAINEQFEQMESSEALSPEDAQKYNIVVSNLKKKAEELGLLDNNFFTALQNVNLYNPSASDRALISTEFRRVFAGNTDPLITGWLDAIGVDAQPVTSINEQNMHKTTEKNKLLKNVSESDTIKVNTSRTEGVDINAEEDFGIRRHNRFAGSKAEQSDGAIIENSRGSSTTGNTDSWTNSAGIRKSHKGDRKSLDAGDGKSLNFIEVNTSEISESDKKIVENNKLYNLETVFFQGVATVTDKTGATVRTITDGCYHDNTVFICEESTEPHENISSHEKIHALKRKDEYAYDTLYQQVLKNIDINAFLSEARRFQKSVDEAYGQNTHLDVVIEELLANLSYEIHSDNVPSYVTNVDGVKKAYETFWQQAKNVANTTDNANKITQKMPVSSENTFVNEDVTNIDVDLPEAFKHDENGKIRFNQVDIDYTDNNYREKSFNTLKRGGVDTETQKGGIIGKYGIHKKSNGYFGVNLLSSGMDIAAFESFEDALKFVTYTNESISFNDVSYTKNAEGQLTIEATPEFMQYGEQIRAIKNEKAYLQTEIATDESQAETSAVTKKDGVSFKPNSKIEDVNNSSFRETSPKVLKNKVENDTIEEDVGVIKYSLESENKKIASQIDNSFNSVYDKWIADGKPNRKVLIVGQTSDALQSIGVKKQQITGDTSKINKSIKEHPDLSDAILKKIPQVLESPIIVMQSLQSDSRLTMFGDLADESGKPVLVVIELAATSRSNIQLDEIKVVSTYGKDNAQSLINRSDILYVEPNKKRTDNWLMSNRLQLPLDTTNYGSIKSITYPAGDVNTYSMQKRGKYSLESEAENEQGNNILNGSKQRNVSERSSKQTERVGKSSRRGSKKSIRERQEFVRTLTDAQKEERILIDSEGKRHKFTIVKKSAWNEHMKSIAKNYETKGLTIEFVDGGIKIEWVKRFARGMRNGDTIYVSYNSAKYSPEQIAEHEYIHNKYDSDEVREAKKQILKRMPKEEYDKAVEEVGEAYSGVAKKSEIEEELICNILSGMYENSAEYADIANAYWSKSESKISGYDVSQYAENIDAGGELNESRNSEELGGQGISENNDSVWQRSDDSEGVYECLGTGKKRLYRSQEEGNRHIDWGRRFGDLNVYEPREKEHAYGVLRKISQLKISSQDSDGRKLSKEQKNFFKDTVAKNSKGELFTLYHATDAQFNEFLFGDFAFHVGTLGQALRIDNKGKKYIKEVYVNITNPVFISEDTMHWPGLAVASKLEAQGIISSSDYKNLSKVDGFWKIDYNSDANKEIRNILKEKGYDGIVYNNGFEGDSISFMAFDPNQIKYTSNKNPTTNSDLRYSLADDGEYDLFDLWEQKNKEFGTIKKGEIPARDINVPKKISKDKLVSRFARTMLEAGVTPDFAVSEFERAILDGTMTHEKITNKNAEKKAKEKIKRDGFSEAMRDWETYSKDGKVSKDAFVLGMELYNQCITNKDVTNAMKIAAELVSETTRAGQTLQAARMLKRMSPDGQLYYIEKSVQKMEQEFKNKLGDKFEGITLDEELMKEFLTAADEEKRNAVYDEICQNIADQVPASTLEKWDSWRRLAMLGNPRTHFGNIGGNIIFGAATRIKNYVGAVIEISARIDTSDRTKSMRKNKVAVEFAKDDFKKMEKELQGQDAKYAVTSDIRGKRTIFKTKWLEFLRRKNFEFLEAEDMWFIKAHYVDALARLLTVRKLDPGNIDGKTLDTLRALAIKEAQEATFRDTNSLAEALNAAMRRYSNSESKGERAIGILLEGAMPFTQTPLNIAKQGVNYSPVGLTKGIYEGLAKLKNGESYSTSDVIDDLAKGLTGTGIMLLGFLLASMGLLSGKGDENKKKRAFDTMVGEQSYAFYIGGKSYTIDWMAPTCLPLFIGVELFELTDETMSMSDIANATLTLADPLLELTVLSGLNSAIKSSQYSETNALSAFISELAIGYTLQGLPSIGGQISRIIDKNKREYYYTDKTKDIPKSVQRLIGRAASKIPFASLLFETSVDEWGREESYGNIFERVVENTLSRGYYSAGNYTAVDEELKELYERTGDAAVLPTSQQKYYTKDKVRYDMSAKIYTEVKKLRGEKSFNYISKLIKSNRYKNMSDEKKVKAIKKCYDQAGEETKKEMFEKVKTGNR